MKYDGLDPAALSERLGAPSCLALEKVTSTLDIIHELAGEGAPCGTLVLADEQVQGRGRQSRRWHSPKGSGVWLGSLKRPSVPLEGGLLAIRAGLCLIRALGDLDVSAQLKWPNDIMVHDRKLAGILCEARWRGQEVSWIAVGIGINVHGPLPAEIADHAIALDEVLPGVGRLPVLDALMPWLRALPDQPSLDDHECLELGRCDWLAGRRVAKPLYGTARGIDRDGALLIETGEGVERVLGGTIVTA
jgi:BirA family biotin operon repressor/biotin-[acetyl-CoA-carboxylase] ligase